MAHQTTTGDVRLRVGIGGLGGIGRNVAKALIAGMPGLELSALGVRNRAAAAKFLAALGHEARLTSLAELVDHADVIVECLPSAAYDEIAIPAIEAGRTLVTLSSGALLQRRWLIDRAAATGARIIVPSGGILGLDGLRAAAEREVHSVVLVTRKPPRGLAGAPWLVEQNIRVDGLETALQVFSGNALEAAAAFPANVNVAATLSLAGIDPERMRVEIWADPAVDQNIQEVHVDAEAASFRLRLQSSPLAENPRTGSLTPLSAIAALRSLTAPLRVGA